MVEYRKILEYHFNGMTQRTIQLAVNSSRNTIREVIQSAKQKRLTELTEDMTDVWLEGFLFPEKHSPKRKVSSRKIGNMSIWS